MPKVNCTPFGSNFLCNETHPLFRLLKVVDWSQFEQAFGNLYSEGQGRPAKPTRLMVGLHNLKHAFDLSDEEVVFQWVENPYWQYFCGEDYFQHELPIDPSLMTKWRNRLKSEGLETVLAETVRAGLRTKVLKRTSLNRLNVDTTVQEKAVGFPTDAKLYHRMRIKLVKEAVEQAERLGDFAAKAIFVDRGYRGHNHEGPAEVHAARRGIRRVKPSPRRWLKRRSAIEPVIGHMKNDGRLGRNHLLGREDDRINAILCGAGHNIRKLLRAFLLFLFWRLFKYRMQPPVVA